jgi:hypothetical protein
MYEELLRYMQGLTPEEHDRVLDAWLRVISCLLEERHRTQGQALDHAFLLFLKSLPKDLN